MIGADICGFNGDTTEVRLQQILSCGLCNVRFCRNYALVGLKSEPSTRSPVITTHTAPHRKSCIAGQASPKPPNTLSAFATAYCRTGIRSSTAHRSRVPPSFAPRG